MKRQGGYLLLLIIMMSAFCTSASASAAENNWGYEHLLTHVITGEICRTEGNHKFCYSTENGQEIRGTEIYIDFYDLSRYAFEGRNRCSGRAFYLDLMEEDEDGADIVRSFVNYFEIREDGSYQLGKWQEYYVNPDVVEDDGQAELFLRFFIAGHPLDMTMTVSPPLYYILGTRN